MKSFDDGLVHKTVAELFDMVKSKQAEVDELRFQRDVLSNKVDELQKMIDDCIKAMDESICDIDCGTIYGILTGEQS